MPDPVVPHSSTGKALHWGFIVVFIYALTKQLDEVEELEDSALLHNEMVFATVVFLVLLLVRFFYMRATRPTALPAKHAAYRTTPGPVRSSVYVRRACADSGERSVHRWVCTRRASKSGLAMDAALLAHEIAVNGTYTLMVGHIAAAIYHRRKADGIWNAMVPVWKEPDR